MPYTYNKLRGRIVEKFGSQDKFAEAINLSRNSVSKKMNCQSGFSQNDIVVWSALLDIEPIEYGEYFFS